VAEERQRWNGSVSRAAATLNVLLVDDPVPAVPAVPAVPVALVVTVEANAPVVVGLVAAVVGAGPVVAGAAAGGAAATSLESAVVTRDRSSASESRTPKSEIAAWEVPERPVVAEACLWFWCPTRSEPAEAATPPDAAGVLGAEAVESLEDPWLERARGTATARTKAAAAAPTSTPGRLGLLIGTGASPGWAWERASSPAFSAACRTLAIDAARTSGAKGGTGARTRSRAASRPARR
jgi:hypothetical protein